MVQVCAQVDELVDHVATVLTNQAIRAVDIRGAFHLALSGGRTPEVLFRRLVIDPQYRALPWRDTHVWLVDERRVPEDHEQSNLGSIRGDLLDHVPIRSRQVHAVPVAADRPAGEYEQALRSTIGGPVPRLDFALLGMGADGHTASLFPGSPALREQVALVAVNDGPAVTPPPRVTMTYRLLNAARYVGILVTGQGKAATVARVQRQYLDAAPDPHNLPIAGVNPDDGMLAWYLDAAAAGAGR